MESGSLGVWVQPCHVDWEQCQQEAGKGCEGVVS